MSRPDGARLFARVAQVAQEAGRRRVAAQIDRLASDGARAGLRIEPLENGIRLSARNLRFRMITDPQTRNCRP